MCQRFSELRSMRFSDDVLGYMPALIRYYSQYQRFYDKVSLNNSAKGWTNLKLQIIAKKFVNPSPGDNISLVGLALNASKVFNCHSKSEWTKKS